MITKELCVKIYHCYDEIEKAEKLLSELATRIREDKEKTRPTLNNAFGERVGLQLGVPSGNGGHTLYGVNFDLSIKVIESHIENHKARLKELEVMAKLELNNPMWEVQKITNE